MRVKIICLNRYAIYADGLVADYREPELIIDTTTSWSGSIAIDDTVEAIVAVANGNCCYTLPTCVLTNETETYYNTEYSAWGQTVLRVQIQATSSELTAVYSAPNAYAVKAYFIYKKLHY